MVDASVFFFGNNDVIMTSPLLLKILYVSANFLDLIRNLRI